MSGSTEIPDIVGGIANTTGKNRLWQTGEQSDSEKRKLEQETEEKTPADAEEARQSSQTPEEREHSRDAAPISIQNEWEKEPKSHTVVDHDIEIHGVPRRWTPPISHEENGYEHSMPTSLNDSQLKIKDKSEPSLEGPGPRTDEKPQQEEQITSFTDIPALSHQEPSSGAAPKPQSTPLSKESLSERPRPHSLPSQPTVDRPKTQRKSTMPVTPTSAGSSENRESKLKSAMRSKWISATNALRLPIRRPKSKISTEGAELIALLAAGAPAANIFASHMIADERSHSRIPVILELLKIKIVDSQPLGRGRFSYRINLTYGDGPSQMKWTIQREDRDFQALHNRLRLLYLGKRDKIPEFPHSMFPFWLGNFGGLRDIEKSEIKENMPEQLGPTIAAGVGTIAATVAVPGKITGILDSDGILPCNAIQNEVNGQRTRPGLNRLCKFLELSTMGIRLASEGAYHGKEGWLVITGSKGSNAAMSCSPHLFKLRHTPKWFMVRHSYIICVEKLEGLNIYDVLLVDSDFRVEWRILPGLTTTTEESSKSTSHHFFTISNAEKTFRLGSNSERKMSQFIQSIKMMMAATPWSKKHRFDSFAPIRHNVQCQWLVDGSDYFWKVSEAILKARDIIYIHDWWLSPELHLRRPAAHTHDWRLDHLLQKKAKEGVRIYVIIYENVEAAVPIDSTHTKQSLLSLHPNIFVQRSPRHIGGQNVFFWAHHEKIIAIDSTVGFLGGLDLCFGRWDSSEHVLVDDKPSGFDGRPIGDLQVWPGKDYSNPRVQDFFKLDKPYEDLHDRKRIPRMPWHDVSMQCTGKLARDLARHFVQRWNFLIRAKPPSRPTPLLLPPPDFTSAELERLKLNGTCNVQLVRSCTHWSMGLREKTEHSIQDAYLNCIKNSEHFVYIENQFFITDCEYHNTKIENKIGGAIVDRIKRAHKEGTAWRAIILLPLMPGFPNPIDFQDASCLRLIIHAQYHSLCRGETSIFGRLRKEGIDPKDYINVYGLRGWGKIGDRGRPVTEQVYIHAKIMIVDDRVAIIGSANINERSMRGDRDSEIAAIVEDTEQYEITMAGKPFMVRKFAHTLRMRLQLEHLGVNTDDFEHRITLMHGPARGDANILTSLDPTKSEQVPNGYRPHSFNHDDSRLDGENHNTMNDISPKEDEAEKHKMCNPSEPSPHNVQSGSPQPEAGRRKVTTSPNLIASAFLSSLQSHKSKFVRSGEPEQGKRDPEVPTGSNLPQSATGNILPDDQSEHSPHLASSRPFVHRGDGWSIPQSSPKPSRVTGRPIPIVDPCKAFDPLDNSYFHDQWDAIAEHNTAVYRHVFHPMPDNEVKTWSDYKEVSAFGERLAKAENGEVGKIRTQHRQPEDSGPISALGGNKQSQGVGSKGAANHDNTKEHIEGGDGFRQEKEGNKQDLKETNDELTHEKSKSKGGIKHDENELKHGRNQSEQEVKGGMHESKESLEYYTSRDLEHSTSKRRGKTSPSRTERFKILPRDTMEELLSEVKGHLVVWPTDWLSKDNTSFVRDRMQFMEIYD